MSPHSFLTFPVYLSTWSMNYRHKKMCIYKGNVTEYKLNIWKQHVCLILSKHTRISFFSSGKLPITLKDMKGHVWQWFMFYLKKKKKNPNKPDIWTLRAAKWLSDCSRGRCFLLPPLPQQSDLMVCTYMRSKEATYSFLNTLLYSAAFSVLCLLWMFSQRTTQLNLT